MHHFQSFARTGLVLLMAVLLLATRAHALTATMATDVCAADADPCMVTSVVDVSPGATLDFGTRSVVVSGHGRFDFGSGSATILAGDFVATSDGDAIVAAGPLGGELAGGSVSIQARRLCSADSSRPCVFDSSCQLGSCDTRRCTELPSRRCTADFNCVSTCSGSRCLGAFEVSCSTNADCDFGSCGTGLTCSGFASIQSCSTNAECDFGSCSVGAASIDIEGGIEATSSSPGSIRLFAADSVTVRGDVDLSGTQAESSGGTLDVRAFSGDAVVEGALRARGGGFADGGSLDVHAGQDAFVSVTGNLTGGYGNEVYVQAGRDAVLDSDLNLSATTGDSDGGYVGVSADRDVWIGRDATRRRIISNGHSIDTAGGGGGEIGFDSGRDLYVAEGVQIQARGPRGGFGGTLHIDAGGDVDFAGRYDTRARGGGEEGGVGGYMDLFADGNVRFPSSARIDTGGAYAGYVEILAEHGNAIFDGRARIRGSADYEEGSFYLLACRISFGGRIQNDATNGGYSQLDVYESMHLRPGSAMLTRKGDNFLSYRTDDKPPLLEGTVTPAPILGTHSYGGCPVCGNSEIDAGETCDDGNVTDGDGCNSGCQTE